MLSNEEKKHIKDVLADGFNINRNINFPYFLNAIDETNTNTKGLKSQLEIIIHNQRILDNQLRQITDLLNKLLIK